MSDKDKNRKKETPVFSGERSERKQNHVMGAHRKSDWWVCLTAEGQPRTLYRHSQ